MRRTPIEHACALLAREDTLASVLAADDAPSALDLCEALTILGQDIIADLARTESPWPR